MACLTSFTSPAQPASPSPRSSRPLSIAATLWKDFSVARIAADGKKVSRGEELLRIDTTRLDRCIHLLKRKVARSQRRLDRKRQHINSWRTTSSQRLEKLLEAAVTAKDAEEYFRKHLRLAKKDSASQAIERTGLLLSGQIQEYRMIFGLEKAKISATSLSSRAIEYHQGIMAAAEFCLGMEVLNHRKVIESQLPREARSLAGAAEDARRRYAAALDEHAQFTHAAGRSVRQQEDRLSKACSALVALETDRMLCQLHAPMDGWFHHAHMADESQTLTIGSHLVAGVTYATFTPAAIVFPPLCA